MVRQDESGPFARVGRIEIGRTQAVHADSGDGTAWQAALAVKDPHGILQPLAGRGPDLAAAIAAALAPLTRMPFAIDTLRTTPPETEAGRWSVKVIVRALDERRPRAAAGHAMAGDEPTAIAIAAARGLAAGGFLHGKFLPAGARDVEASTETIVQGIEGLLGGAPLGTEIAGEIRALVFRELNRFGEGQAILAAHSPAPERMLTRFDAQAALAHAAGEPRTSDTRTGNWWEWFPGLDNDARTLREVLAELPAAPPSDIPWIVRLFENDQGWLRLHGAVNLANHDIIHVLLGRGLLDQDEAFVLGFTMGSTKAVSRLERWFFKLALSRLYPEPYRISRKMLVAYDLGLEAGRECGVKNVHLALDDTMLDRPLGETRHALRIDPQRLRHFYAREQQALPGTLASLRLPVAG